MVLPRLLAQSPWFKQLYSNENETNYPLSRTGLPVGRGHSYTATAAAPSATASWWAPERYAYASGQIYAYAQTAQEKMTKPTFIICLVLMVTSIGIALGLVFGGAMDERQRG